MPLSPRCPPTTSPTHALGHTQVPQGHVWIQGDNLLHSLDSRAYGPVPLGLVRGRVMCQVSNRASRYGGCAAGAWSCA